MKTLKTAFCLGILFFLNHQGFIEAHADTIDETQFIFVDGIFGDYLKQNFGPAFHHLDSEHPAAEKIVIRPKTDNAIEVNAELTFQKINEFRFTSAKKKTVIVAHSKGGAETLVMLLRHPEAIRLWGLEKVVLVSAPLAGTDVIDVVQHFCADVPKSTCDELYQRLPVLDAFTPVKMKALVTESMNRPSSADRALLESKIYYVRTQMKETDFYSPLYFPHTYLSLIHPEEKQNDGIIATRNELIYEHGFDGTDGDHVFGTDLGIFMGDHNSLLNSTSFQNTEAKRQLFFKNLLQWIR